MRLEIENAAFSYNGTKFIFENINFAVEASQVFCLLGPNGTGKSTLLQCLNGMLPLDKGIVRLDNQDLRSWKRHEIAQRIAYVPQSHVPTFPFSVIQIVLMGRTPHLGFLSAPRSKDYKIAEQALDQLGILSLRDVCYTEISGGERQLVLLAAALAQEASLLILDEPTSHLDFGNQIRLLRIIEQLSSQGKAIIMCTHFPDHALLTADTVAIMKKGTITKLGIPHDVITEQAIYDTYGIKTVIGSIAGNEDMLTCVPKKNQR